MNEGMESLAGIFVWRHDEFLSPPTLTAQTVEHRLNVLDILLLVLRLLFNHLTNSSTP